MGLDDCDTGLCDPLNVQNGVRHASLSVFLLCLLFSPRLPKGILSYSQSCLNRCGSPAHATLHSNPQTHIAPICTHKHNFSSSAEPLSDYWESEFSSVPLAAIQRLLPDLLVIYEGLHSICVSVVSSCREPTVSSALRDYASASLTTS